MKLYGSLLVATLLTLPACERTPNVDQADGIKDAFDARPHESARDAGEDVGDAVLDAGRAAKDAVDGD
ncbi:MAG: hypothetical protein H0T47_03655 [Planctomycetaceae bacterium]|nr:hypothetical protein [Planctomycetaceae bacterium]